MRDSDDPEQSKVWGLRGNPGRAHWVQWVGHQKQIILRQRHVHPRILSTVRCPQDCLLHSIRNEADILAASSTVAQDVPDGVCQHTLHVACALAQPARCTTSRRVQVGPTTEHSASPTGVQNEVRDLPVIRVNGTRPKVAKVD